MEGWRARVWQVRDIKDSLNSVLDLIEMKLHGGAQERSHQQAMTTITRDMKRVKHVLQEQNLDQLEEVGLRGDTGRGRRAQLTRCPLLRR